MATVNPYDRREEAKRRPTPREYRSAMFADPQDRQFTPPMALAVEDLNALALSVHTRGRQAAIDELRPIHAEAERAGRRQAWDEGHAAGHGDGEIQLLARIAELYEAITEELRADISQVLADDGAKVENMRPLLSRAHGLLDNLIAAHHSGFEPPVPF